MQDSKEIAKESNLNLREAIIIIKFSKYLKEIFLNLIENVFFLIIIFSDNSYFSSFSKI